MTTAAYIRVSTDQQDPKRQKSDIQDRFGVNDEDFYADVEHGDVFTGRDGLDDLMETVEDYESVVFDELNRLGRNAREIRDSVQELHEKGVDVTILDPNYTFPSDDSDPLSSLLLDILSWFAEEELRQIRRRTQSGIRQAIKDGKHVGEPPTGFDVEDGFLEPNDRYDRVLEFVRQVNKGRPKAPTAEFFGFKRTSAQAILETTMKEKYPYEERYCGDEEWRRRRTEVQNGDRELEPLGGIEA